MVTKFDGLSGSMKRVSREPLRSNDPNVNQKRRRISHNDKHKDAFRVALNHNSLLDEDDEDDEQFTSNNLDTDSFFSGTQFSNNFHIDADDTQITAHTFQGNNEYYNVAGSSNRKLVVKRKKQNVDSTYREPASLISVNILPDSFQSVFEFTEFNKMQSEAFNDIYKNDENCIVSAPTGSGKTVLFELAIIGLLQKSNMLLENQKILYLAPTKSLCYEIKNKWSSKFLNLTVGMMTSDTSYIETESVKKSNIIITTPEKWDLLTRKWKDYGRLFELIKLILVDEIHTLGDRRGATLEAVLTRMNTMCENIRIISVSATIPNIDDIAIWLKTNRGYGNKFPAKVLKFNDDFRQVSLEKHVYGYSFNCKNEFQRDSIYNMKLTEIMRKHSKNRPILIFCPTRASTVSTAKYLSSNYDQYNRITSKGLNRTVNDKVLRECMKEGIAFHNAGLSLDDRTTVEASFVEGKIQILCSTSTLAVGVNLPAYLVIIKGTKMWNVSETSEYPNIEVLQMIGRAGRPQFETEGCAVIMTEISLKTKYENLVSGSDILESKLHLELLEHLCSEISLGTITSTESAIAWIHNTFFYVRFMKNPNSYRELSRFHSSGSTIDNRLVQFCEYLLNKLQDEQLIKNIDNSYSCTPFGYSMVRHYISHETIRIYIDCQRNLNLNGVLNHLVKAGEFAEFRVRQNEKRLYKEINLSPLVRYPYLTEKKQSQIIDQTSQKISLIIQYELGGLEFPSYEGANKLYHILVQDKIRTFKHCFRVLRCMVDCFIEKQDGRSLKNALFLLRSINGICWEDSAMVLRQLKSVGLVSVRKLISRGISNFSDMSASSNESIEYYLGLKIGSGMKIMNDLNLLPKINIRYKLESCSPVDNHVDIMFKIEISSEFKTQMWHGKRLSLDIVIHKASGTLIDFRRILLNQLETPRTFRVSSTIESRTDDIEFSIDCQEVAGLGKNVSFMATDLPERYSSILKSDCLSTVLEKCIFTKTLEDSEDEHSSSSDESLFQYLEDRKASQKIETTKPNIVTTKPVHGRKVLFNGNYECFHACKYKNKCRHLCCKDGIPQSMVNDRKIEPKRNKQFSNQSQDSIAYFSSRRSEHIQDHSVPQLIKNTVAIQPSEVDRIETSSEENNSADKNYAFGAYLDNEDDNKENTQTLPVEQINILSSDNENEPDANGLTKNGAQHISNEHRSEASDSTSSQSSNNRDSQDLSFLGSNVDLR